MLQKKTYNQWLVSINNIRPITRFKSNLPITNIQVFIDNNYQLVYFKKRLSLEIKMKQQGFSILLILMMLITPIASAFEHCENMGMSNYLSASQSLTLSTHDNSTLNHQQIFKGQSNMDCQNSSSCTTHVCSGYGIISTALSFNIVLSLYYSNSGYTSLYSTEILPALRPPKSVLS
ncbi:MAG: hypothetical protein GQ532_03905 [Methylomarinum sp.]|nr:hypothetical protein [Methylomarinum sp.]